MFKKLWGKLLNCILTEHGIELDLEATQLLTGIALGFILTTAIIVAGVK